MGPSQSEWSLLSQLAHRAGAYPGFRSMKRLGVFLLFLDGMLVHHRSLPSNLLGFPQQFASTHLYSWVERGTVRVKCLAQERNTMSPARARTQTARSGDERTNHEATVPLFVYICEFGYFIFFEACQNAGNHCEDCETTEDNFKNILSRTQLATK